MTNPWPSNSSKSAPSIIAEISANHDGSIESIKRSISGAHEAGADLVKIQSYIPEQITCPSHDKHFQIHDGLWSGTSLFNLYQKGATPREWLPKLFEHADKIGATLFSTPFDLKSLEALEENNCPLYKISSFDIINTPLITAVAKTNKPLIVSTGMAAFSEIASAVEIIRAASDQPLAVLHCVSSYPTEQAHANVLRIQTLKDKLTQQYRIDIGYSDHTIGNVSGITAVTLGARVIEKHFKGDLFNTLDEKFSLSTEAFRNYVTDLKNAYQTIGTGNIDPDETEATNLRFRPSLFYDKALPAGHILTEEDLRVSRPNLGLAPKEYDQLIGKTIQCAVNQYQATSWSHIQKNH